MEEKKFFDFNSDKEFNLNEEYSILFNGEEFKKIDPNERKLKDAEDIIKDFGRQYMDVVSLKRYEDSYVNLNLFIDKFSVESDVVKKMTKNDRDKLFGYGKELFIFYQNQYKGLTFNFEISRKEWSYVAHTLNKKMSYNGDEVFNYWELYTKFIEPTSEIESKLNKNIESFTPICSIQNLVLLSHILMKHEEKGGSESFKSFRNVLAEIGKMMKLFNAYGVILERISGRFDNWVNSLNSLDELFGENNNEKVE